MCDVENEQELDYPTLLNHLLRYYLNPKEYLDILDNLEETEINKNYFEKHPDLGNSDIVFVAVDTVFDAEAKTVFYF